MRIRRAIDRGARDDLGTTLLETVVAMLVFTVMATMTLALVVRTSQVTVDGNRRTIAANLLTTQLESVRSLSAMAIPDGLTVTTKTSGNTTYTIRQNASYLSSGAAGSVCEGSGASLAYKKISVSITWPDMGTVQPVRGDTLKAVGIGTGNINQLTTGSLAVLVRGYDSEPRAGVTVSLPSLSFSQVTGEDGCVVFAGLAPGGYSVTANAGGYVSVYNAQAASIPSVSIAAATITRSTIDYDEARSVDVALSDSTSYVPTQLKLGVGSSYLTTNPVTDCPPSPTSVCKTGLPGTVKKLFPTTYTVSVGACPAPSPSQATVDLRVPAGTVPTATVPVGTVRVNVVDGTATSLAGRTVTAVPTTACSDTHTLPSTTAGGSSFILPYGSWKISTLKNPPGAATVSTTVTLSPSTPTANITLTVNH